MKAYYSAGGKFHQEIIGRPGNSIQSRSLLGWRVTATGVPAQRFG